MAGTDTIVGSGSLMPESLYLGKIEQTCMFEDNNQLGKYFRQELKDYRPNKPFFESDQPRRRNYSEDRLNLRHGGSRTLTDPYLPDGTFLDFQFLEKDVRGNAVGPDMREHRKQQHARDRFIKFYDDSHFHVPESGIHPSTMQMNIKNELYNVKNRMKIFDTSRNGWHNGGTAGQKLTKTGVCLQQKDAKMYGFSGADEAVCYNNARKITDLSNYTDVGWRRTTDNRFQVSRYTDDTRALSIKNSDWFKNRTNTRMEHDILFSKTDKNVSKCLAQKMSDIVELKKNMMHSSRFPIKFASSQNIDNKKRKIQAENIEQMREHVRQTGTKSAHTKLADVPQNQRVKGEAFVPQRDDNRMSKSVLNPIMFDYMALSARGSNKKLAEVDAQALRGIKEVVVSRGTSFMRNDSGENVSRKFDSANHDLLWKVETGYKKGKSYKIANYKNKQMDEFPGRSQDIVAYEKYKKSSKASGQRNGGLQNPRSIDVNSTSYDNPVGMENSNYFMIGPLGSKFMRNGMIRDNKTSDDSMIEIAASN